MTDCDEQDILEIIRGDDESIEVIIVDEAEVSQLKSGDIIFFTVKRRIGDSDENALFKKDATLNSDTDKYTMDLSNTETELPIGSYYCDVKWKSITNDDFKTVYRGTFNVEYHITDRKVPIV